MRNMMMILLAALCLVCFTGCQDMDPGSLIQQVETIASQVDVETIASQVDVEGIVTGLVEQIDWNALKEGAEDGYDALTERYPALKQENIKAFLKDNGLKLMQKLVSNADESSQETARKLGGILKILSPGLAEEVDAVIAE